MRTLDSELTFAEWLLKLGNGELNDLEDEVILPEGNVCYENLEVNVFEEPIRQENWKTLTKYAILAPFHAQVDEFNEKVLSIIPGNEKIYYSYDEAMDD